MRRGVGECAVHLYKKKANDGLNWMAGDGLV